MLKHEFVQKKAAERLKKREKSNQKNQEQIEILTKPEEHKRENFDWTEVEQADRLAERARRMGLYEESGAILREPKDTKLGNKIYEKIIGANNILDITFLSEGARMSRAVGRITLPVSGGRRLGTGFMVSSRIMMTNNHVLSDRLEAEKATLEFDYYTREDSTIGPVTRFKLEPSKFFVTDANLDFTLVAVESKNTAGLAIWDRGWFPLSEQSGKAVVGERLSIIHHPNGEPQKVTIHDNQLVSVKEDNPFLHYVTDTMGGSSGSPVLNIDWDLVALHHAAVQKSNEGIRISSIVSHLKKIFNQESAVTNPEVEQVLLVELLEGTKPIHDPAHGSYADPGGAGGSDSSPRINPDGTVSWTIPLSVTLGLGSANLAGTSVAVSSPAETPPTDVAIQGDDRILQRAISALEAGDNRVFFSKVNDTKAKEAYYPDLSGLNGSELYDTFSALLAQTHTTTLDYAEARYEHLYPWIDRRTSRSRDLKGIYSNDKFAALELIQEELIIEKRREQAIQEYKIRESTGSLDEAFLEALEATHPFNCEHVVPQSWFNYQKQPKTDLHHLFTCDWSCNSTRGNRAYIDGDENDFSNDCGDTINGSFEPKHGKGAVARATLYFLLRYPGMIADSSDEMLKERLSTLIDWAKDDAIDRWELHRNAEIQKVQGNRNPLIDFPELVDQIDFEKGWA